MASQMKAIQAYSPRIKYKFKSGMKDLARTISGRSLINRGTVMNVLAELHDTIVEYSAKGIPLKLDGIGIFKPGIDRNGNVRINFKPDHELTDSLVKLRPLDYLTVKNRDMIGKTVEDFVARWNGEHPDDPVDE